jgi:hypothetical protein
MGFLPALGKMLKHWKEKPHHKIPYHDLSFFVEKVPAADYGRNATLRLIVQPCDEVTIITFLIVVVVAIFLVMEHRWNEIDRGRPKYSGKPLPVPLC